jgi:hypothetical protein
VSNSIRDGEGSKQGWQVCGSVTHTATKRLFRERRCTGSVAKVTVHSQHQGAERWYHDLEDATPWSKGMIERLIFVVALYGIYLLHAGEWWLIDWSLATLASCPFKGLYRTYTIEHTSLDARCRVD